MAIVRRTVQWISCKCKSLRSYAITEQVNVATMATKSPRE